MYFDKKPKIPLVVSCTGMCFRVGRGRRVRERQPLQISTSPPNNWTVARVIHTIFLSGFAPYTFFIISLLLSYIIHTFHSIHSWRIAEGEKVQIWSKHKMATTSLCSSTLQSQINGHPLHKTSLFQPPSSLTFSRYAFFLFSFWILVPLASGVLSLFSSVYLGLGSMCVVRKETQNIKFSRIPL